MTSVARWAAALVGAAVLLAGCSSGGDGDVARIGGPRPDRASAVGDASLVPSTPDAAGSAVTTSAAAPDPAAAEEPFGPSSVSVRSVSRGYPAEIVVVAPASSSFAARDVGGAPTTCATLAEVAEATYAKRRYTVRCEVRARRGAELVVTVGRDSFDVEFAVPLRVR